MSTEDLPLPLDESLYKLGEAEYEFFSSQTGIKDPEELKEHIISVQSEVYRVHPYNCIRAFVFTKLTISHLPGYKAMLRLGRERPGALYLDLGCCIGSDVRKAVADGFPVTQVVASDLHQEFWDMGHKLFKSTPETLPVPFIQSDAFTLPVQPTPTTPPASLPPSLNTLVGTSLTPLTGYVSALHVSSVFHLFPEAQQRALALRIAPLLSPVRGSLIFGAHAGLSVKGTKARKNSHGIQMFCNSPESWRELWEGVFGAGTVKVEAVIREYVRWDLGEKEVREEVLVWSVTRL